MVLMLNDGDDAWSSIQLNRHYLQRSLFSYRALDSDQRVCGLSRVIILEYVQFCFTFLENMLN